MSAAPSPVSPAPVSPAPGPGPLARLRGKLGGLGGGLLSGGMILLVSTTVVNLGNYLFNLLMGRWLGRLPLRMSACWSRSSWW